MDRMISNKYKIIEQIGSGNFGSVFKGENIRTKENVAIKIAPITNEVNILIHEAKIHSLLNGIHGFPAFKWFGCDNENYYIVMNLLGKSLYLFKKIHHKLSIDFVMNVGEQMIRRLQVLHNKGIIHRDIKPSNFVFGIQNETSVLFLIDYGFCKGYIQQNGTHVPLKKINNVIGSINYISLNVHKKYEPSRRDDIESACYILLYLLDILSWDKYGEGSVTSILKIVNEKEIITQNKNVPMFLKKMIEHTRTLAFDETPDYKLLIHFIRENMHNAVNV